MVFLAVLAIPLSSAHAFSLTDGQLASWIFALYAGPGLLGLVLALRYHQPLVLTGNVFAIILFASEGSRLAFPEPARGVKCEVLPPPCREAARGPPPLLTLWCSSSA